MPSTAILWFRRDLRVHDHPALAAAIAAADHVIPVFVIDDALLAGRWPAPNRAWFMRESVVALSGALAERGAALRILRGRPVDVLPALARETGSTDLFLTRDVTPFGRTRDRAVAARLAEAGVAVHARRGLYVHEPDEVATREGGPYTVYSPFRRAWEALPRRAVLPAPDRIPGPPGAVRDAVPDLGGPSADPALVPEPGEAVHAALSRRRAQVSTLAAPGVPAFSAIENIVVFIRFADEPELTQDRPLAAYEALFNADGDGAMSMRSYFKAASYGQLTVRTSFFPATGNPLVASYQAQQPRAHFMPFDATTNPGGYDGESEREAREKALLAAAVAAIAGQVPASLAIDGNGDGDVDNVCFIVSGTPTAWSTLLWPHQWSLSGRNATINSKRVASFNFQLESMVQVGVLCHEMTHTLGAPDLYHYTSDGQTPVGRWDLMASTTTPPQQINAYTKYRYLGWIKELPAIATSGAYELAPLSSGPNCYKIASPNASREYFLLEYRSQAGAFDGTVPGTGLIVYRINTGVQGNAGGPPDGVYAFRPGGALGVNGAIRDAALGSHAGRGAIDGATDPHAFLTWGDLGGLAISEIGTPGDTIPFTVAIQPACALAGFAPIGPESPRPGGPIELQWSASLGATSYDVHAGAGPEPPLLATTAMTSAAVAAVPGSVMTWRVIAANQCGRLASGPAWRLDVDPVVPVLARGAELPGLEIANGGDWRFFRVDVPPGGRAFTVVTAGGTGDADLYHKMARWIEMEVITSDAATLARIAQARAIQPSLPIILMTDQADFAAYAAINNLTVLRPPVSAGEFIATIRRLGGTW